MKRHQKKYPALTDSDEMPFGEYQGEPMEDVPAEHFAEIWVNGCDDELVMNYIHNHKEAIERELGGPI